MSDSTLKETDPVLQIYEAQAIIVEKDQEIERLRQEIERLRIDNSNKNLLELAQKVTTLEEDLASKNNNLAELLENLSMKQNRNQKELSQKITKLEEDLAASKADNLQLKEQITALHLNISTNDQLSDKVEELVANQSQSAVQTENKVENESRGQQNTSVLILGGWFDLNTIYLLDSNALSWKKLSITLPVEMHDLGAVVLNEEIYIFGGTSKKVCHQHCYKLKDDGSWIKLASLNQKRSAISSSSLVYKGDIWVIGGDSEDFKEYLKSVEKYDVSQDKWTYIPEMNYARSYAAAAVFKDRIFVTGGRNKKKLKSVEMFDPILQKWIFFCDLPFEISRHTILINNSTLSIFGGESESGSLKSVWEMDIKDPEKKWTDRQSFRCPRYSFGIGKLSNGIIVFGTSRGCGETSEIFDGNKWITGPYLPQRLSDFAYTSIPRSLEERFLTKFS